MKQNKGLQQVIDVFVVSDKYLDLQPWVKQLQLTCKMTVKPDVVHGGAHGLWLKWIWKSGYMGEEKGYMDQWQMKEYGE
jgi:hypothetical protein